MKSLFFSITAVLVLAIAPLGVAFSSDREAQLNPNEPTNYVVIGAFSIKRNAIKFTEDASARKAKFEMNLNRNLYYVYVMTTEDHEVALKEATKLRNESPYYDAWVYYGVLGRMVKTAGVDIHPETKKSFQPKDQDLEEKSSNASITSNPPLEEKVITEPKTEEKPADNTEKSELDTEITGKAFIFNLYRADNNNALTGNVDVIDADRSRKMGTYEGNRKVGVSSPGSRSGKISLICEVFGYRKIQRDIDYENPVGEDITVDNNITTIPFELVRLRKGDIAVMYNVYFFKDAAVMRPESRYEVNSLLEMLKENPKYKIKIHGHTNGNAHGKIISMGKDSDDFFSLTNTQDGFGSAKKLSEERALVIKGFLVDSGINEKRMEVKAWGGKRPIVDKMHSQAQANVRVEIEILED
jgi:outer membrane protein OmpA-like peptidoglycan-associated protein